jgi:hypothetical protein
LCVDIELNAVITIVGVGIRAPKVGQTVDDRVIVDFRHHIKVCVVPQRSPLQGDISRRLQRRAGIRPFNDIKICRPVCICVRPCRIIAIAVDDWRRTRFFDLSGGRLGAGMLAYQDTANPNRQVQSRNHLIDLPKRRERHNGSTSLLRSTTASAARFGILRRRVPSKANFPRI